MVQQLGKSIDIISGSNEIIKMLIGYKTEVRFNFHLFRVKEGLYLVLSSA